MATSTHSITITGKVQDIGFRNTIEHILRNIKGDTSALVIEMREHNKEQRGHNTRLEAILEKLAGK
jgi:hypothetical protein